MTEESQGDGIKQLSENDKADENQSSSPQQDDAPEENSQLESESATVDAVHPKQDSSIVEGESHAEDSSFQEPKAHEDGEPVEQAQSGQGDDKPVENGENAKEKVSEDNNSQGSSNANEKASEVQNTEQIESRSGDGEQEQVADGKNDVTDNEEQQGEVKPAAQEGDATSAGRTGGDSDANEKEDVTTTEEQLGEVTPAGETQDDGTSISHTGAEQQQDALEKTGVNTTSEEQLGEVTAAGEAQEGDATSVSQTEQQEHQKPTHVEQREVVAASYEQQGSPTQHEGCDNPVEPENKKTTEKKRNETIAEAEERKADGEETKEILPEKNSSDGEAQPASGEQRGSANETAEDATTGNDTGLESQAMESGLPVESGQQSFQPEAVLQADETPLQKTDQLQEENRKLKQDIFMMKQQEDAYRIKVLSLEQEVAKLRARKIDNRSQDSLASDSDSYLKQKLAETERELDTAERKVKDLQLRLKRFAKDDQIKDEKISQMEREVKELSDHVKRLEQSLADCKRENNNNATVQASVDKNDSKVCVIL